MRRESGDAAVERLQALAVLAESYPDFVPFLRDGMQFLGFALSDIQEDIGLWIAHGPASLMVQAQRGQAKTTIAALYAIWSLIHNPKTRVLIVSAGGTQANEISTLIVRVITTWDILECLRPDASAGDRTSVEHFDIHHTLKGVDKSPSVACVGIGSNMQGKRADILIADDVESAKNATTATQRALLTHLTLDFVSIAMGQQGIPPRIIWLGTPQSTDSIYNGLPARGVAIRIWPGRYPTPDEVEHYGAHLAPLIAQRIARNPSLQRGGGPLGDMGKPTDPSYLGEEVLQRKQADQGLAYFQLQHMLNTRLTDAMRYPLKPERLIVMRLGLNRMVPTEVHPDPSVMALRQYQSGDFTFRLGTPLQQAVAVAYARVPTLHMYVDPAGGGINGDETGYAISGAMNGNVFLFAVGGIPGGYERHKLLALVEIAKLWGVNVLTIEKNMGFGAFREVLLPLLRAEHPTCAVEDDMVHGQKELRIANTLEPVLGRGSLVINEDIVESDWTTAKRYAATVALTYSFFFQLAKLTRDRNSLVHDDRLDAVEGTVRYWQVTLGLDQNKAKAEAEAAAWRAMTADPLGRNRYRPPNPGGGSTLMNRLRRR